MVGEQQCDAKPWHSAALELAKATYPLANRSDARGGYYYHRGDDCVKTTTRKDGLTKRHFLEHFQARWIEDVIGLHCLNPETNTGRFVVVDIDDHGDDDDPEGNERFAIHIFETMAARSVRVLCFNWPPSGGYHCWIIFDELVPGAKLHAFGEWVASQASPWIEPQESFPKQADAKGKYGSWARLFGMHPKHLTWPIVFDGEAWRGGQSAVDTVLGVLA